VRHKRLCHKRAWLQPGRCCLPHGALSPPHRRLQQQQQQDRLRATRYTWHVGLPCSVHLMRRMRGASWPLESQAEPQPTLKAAAMGPPADSPPPPRLSVLRPQPAQPAHACCTDLAILFHGAASSTASVVIMAPAHAIWDMRQQPAARPPDLPAAAPPQVRPTATTPDTSP
jgi:hypothetical protein